MVLVRGKIPVLELHAHISLKDLVLIERINGNVAIAASAKRTIDAPGVGVCQVQADGVGKHVSGFNCYPPLVNAAIVDIGINQVGVQSVLSGVLILGPDFPIVLCL